MTRAGFASAIVSSVLAAGVSGCRRGGEEAAPRSFDEARVDIERDVARDAGDATLNALCVPRLYHHSYATRDAVLLFHGFTNCPQQFDELARGFHARGCNVYVPRIPHHGKRDRLTQDLEGLNVAEMEAFAERSFELVRALGSRTIVLGLSLGGTLAMWLAQTRRVDTVLPVAPFLMPAGWQRTAGRALMDVAQTMPNVYWWWDVRKLAGTRPLYAYPGYPLHALAQVTFLGDRIFALAAREKPAARRCVLVTNAGDNGISNDVARDLLAQWRHDGAPYRETVLRDLGAPRHDIIDPSTFPAARTLVYPRLESLAFAG